MASKEPMANENLAVVGADHSGRILPEEARPLRRSSRTNHEQTTRLRIRIRHNHVSARASREGRTSSAPSPRSRVQSKPKFALKNPQFLIATAGIKIRPNHHTANNLIFSNRVKNACFEFAQPIETRARKRSNPPPSEAELLPRNHQRHAPNPHAIR
jgi:hypothetical protein